MNTLLNNKIFEKGDQKMLGWMISEHEMKQQIDELRKEG